jgi:Ras-related protein Rab-1A
MHVNDEKSSSGVIMVYDVTDEKSFDNVTKCWVPEVEKYAPDDTCKMLIANKSDDAGKRQVTTK